ncbi:MAG: hypothetical protein ACO3RG_03600, partial [Nitriliruptoraceae bacterium]
MGQESASDDGAGGPESTDTSRRRAISAAGAAALGITTFRLPSATAAATDGGGDSLGVISTGEVGEYFGAYSYVLHTFTSTTPGSFTVGADSAPLDIDYLLVGGGGG